MMRPMQKTVLRCCTTLLAITLLSGCLSVPNIPYQSSVRNSSVLMAGGYAPMQVGAFNASAGVENHTLNVRGANSLSGSKRDGTFSTYLQEALQSELATAGLLDPASGIVITGTLLQNQLTAGVSTGTSVLSARFVVTRDGKTVYDRVLTANHNWESSFMAAVAVPAAFDNHVATVQQLVGKLLEDPDFKRAAAIGS